MKGHTVLELDLGNIGLVGMLTLFFEKNKVLKS